MRDVRRLHEQLEVGGLDRVRLVWLLLGGAVSLGLAFGMGVVVGRGSVEQPQATQVAPQPEAPPTDTLSRIDSERATHEKLTFYKTLTEEGETVVKSRKISTAKGASEQAEKPVATKSEEAAKKSVAAPSPPAAEAKPAEPAAEKKPAPAAGSLANAIQRARDTSRVDPKSVRSGLHEGPANHGEYTVQVGSFESLSEANAFAAGLQRTKGYDPFVVSADIPGRGTWYRVRIGRFTAKATANEAQKVLAGEDLAGLVYRME